MVEKKRTKEDIADELEEAEEELNELESTLKEFEAMREGPTPEEKAELEELK